MTILVFLVQLLSGAMLLLFAVRVIRSGIEREFRAEVQAQFNEDRPGLLLLTKGAALGFALQGGTVVLLMGASLTAQGLVGPVGAAMIAVGAELGSAIAVKALHISTSAIGPLLILVGGWCYLNLADTTKGHNVGRIVLGLGLIFLALDIIKLTVAPLEASDLVGDAIGLIGADPINAALLGLVLTLVMHSSLVAMLTAASFVAGVEMQLSGALGLMLGCNIGSALLGLWLTRSEPKSAQQVAQAVAILRCGAAGAALLALVSLPVNDIRLAGSVLPVSAMLWGHIAFNFALWAIVFLLRPVTGWLTRADVAASSALSQSLTSDPTLAIAGIKRQVNIMLETLGEMVENATSDQPDPARMAEAEDAMNQRLSELRLAFSEFPSLDPEAESLIDSYMDFAIRVERSADILAGKYMSIRSEEKDGVFVLSDEAAAEVRTQLSNLQASMVLSQHVFWKEDPADARRLIERKQQMAKIEHSQKRQHFARIRARHPLELTSSNQYLEITAALKEITSKLATIGYVVLERHGGLKKTRLKSTNLQK